jgi:DNA-binding LytR/AlgR family response regulator
MSPSIPYTLFIYPVHRQCLEQIKEREGIPVSEQIRLALDQWLRYRGSNPPPLSMTRSSRRRPGRGDGAHTRHNRVLVRDGDALRVLPLSELCWCEADRNIVRLHTKDAEFSIRQTLTTFVANLDPDQFLRIHRSVIVNLDEVASVEARSGLEYGVTLRDGTKLSVSRNYKDQFRERFRATGRQKRVPASAPNQ